MSRKYTKVFSDIAFQQRAPNASPSVPIGANKLRAIRIKAPSEGRLTSMTVKQTETESQVDFEVEILFSQIPWPEIDQDLATATAAADTVTLYRILPKQIGAAGFPVEINEETTGFAYRNIDGNYTNNQRYIYIVLAPGGFDVGAGGTTTWKLEVTVESDVG